MCIAGREGVLGILKALPDARYTGTVRNFGGCQLKVAKCSVLTDPCAECWQYQTISCLASLHAASTCRPSREQTKRQQSTGTNISLEQHLNRTSPQLTENSSYRSLVPSYSLFHPLCTPPSLRSGRLLPTPLSPLCPCAAALLSSLSPSEASGQACLAQPRREQRAP